MPLNMREFKQHVIEYVEIESGSKVISAEFQTTITFVGEEDIIFSVVTDDDTEKDWWVIGGSTPMNLYPKSQFPSFDMAFSFHLGISMRMLERGPTLSDTPPDDAGYDAFICHASEDKDSIARPLANELRSMGFWVWYDEFSLELGDSLRESIDKGLAVSRRGIVILSPSFFQKRYPQYELNGLTVREMEGEKVILPIWHNITKQEVMEHSPPLADKLAISTKNKSINEIAKALRKSL